MTEPQKKLWKAHTALLNKAKAMKADADTARKKFWNKVEGDIDNYDNQLKIDEENWVIEVHEEDCDDCDKDK